MKDQYLLESTLINSWD